MQVHTLNASQHCISACQTAACNDVVLCAILCAMLCTIVMPLDQSGRAAGRAVDLEAQHMPCSCTPIYTCIYIFCHTAELFARGACRAEPMPLTERRSALPRRAAAAAVGGLLRLCDGVCRTLPRHYAAAGSVLCAGRRCSCIAGRAPLERHKTPVLLCTRFVLTPAGAQQPGPGPIPPAGQHRPANVEINQRRSACVSARASEDSCSCQEAAEFRMAACVLRGLPSAAGDWSVQECCGGSRQMHEACEASIGMVVSSTANGLLGCGMSMA
eukprot:jgi/Ulvmu1/8879/UM049_0061.1